MKESELLKWQSEAFNAKDENKKAQEALERIRNEGTAMSLRVKELERAL